MFWSSNACCTALYCYARSALRWSISGFVGIRTGRGRMKLSSARCRARFSKEYICPTSGSRRTTRRGARDHSCIGSISESIRGHSMNWGGVWRTTADRKGYGDTDEEWSRAYRRNGAVRLTITLPDGATKVMYAPDPTPRAWFDDFLATTLPVEFLPQDYIRGVLLGGRPHGTPGDQAVRLIHPSTTCQSPKTQQDHERGDELTARVFAPGRSILSTMGAIL